MLRSQNPNLEILLLDGLFIDSVSGHIPPDDASQARVPMVLETLKEIAGIE